MDSIKPPPIQSLFPNKLRVIYEKSKCQTPLTHIFLLCDVGSAFENKNNRGISHFIEHMVFKGNQSHSAKELYLEFDKKGVQFNAFTTKRYTAYQLVFESIYCLDCLSELSNMLFDSLLLNEEVNRERRIIKKENKMDDIDLSKQAYIQFTSHIYQNSSFEYPVDCLRFHEIENDITQESIQGWYKTFYQPKNMILSIVSSLSKEECLRILKGTKFMNMASIKQEPLLPVPTRFPLNTEIQYILEENDKMNNTNLRIGFRIHDIYSKDKYLFDILCQILNNVSGRFFQILREKEGIVYRIYSEIELEEFVGYFSVQCEMETNQLFHCVSIIVSIFRSLVTNGISDEELLSAKKKLANKVFQEASQNDTVAKYNALEVLYLKNESVIPFTDMYQKRYHLITKKDINLLIIKYLVPSHMIVSILSPHSISRIRLEKICQRFHK